MKSKITTSVRLLGSGHEYQKNNKKRVSKKIYTLLLSAAFSTIGFAQYHPLLENPSWVVTIANFGGSNNVVIQPGVDIVIGGVTYKKFIDSAWGNTEVFLREDAAAQKVYRRINNVDVLLYDFSLTVGSTISLSNGLGYNVTSVENIPSADGTTRKRIHLNNFITSETWIEGVGSPNNPLKPSYELPSDPYLYVQCSFQNGVNIYNHGLVNTGTPTDCAALGTIDQTLQTMTISPNPMKTNATISMASELINAELLIYNPIGQLVRRIKGINGNEFVLSKDNLENGIFLMQLSEEGKIIATRKLIVAD
jgi:hypothetical protein